MLEGKVLITGGTGSLGKAILARAERESWPAEFTVFARNETKISQVRSTFPNVRCEIGDVRDLDWLRAVLPGHDVVIHAAAIKVVPIAEANARETVLTNIVGTMNVAQASVESGVNKVIGVLTDKEVHSSTLYGNSKAVAGALLREANSWGNTLFTMARYGNVLGSANSIYPLFKRQARENKPFTITDTRCTRFWLSMNQAIDLVLLAAQQTHPGVTVVPKAPSSYVTDLAKAIDPDREIVDIGIRAGEKIHELLIGNVESIYTVDFGDYFLVYPPQTSVESNLPFQYEYSSDNPVKWLTSEELLSLAEIED